MKKQNQQDKQKVIKKNKKQKMAKVLTISMLVVMLTSTFLSAFTMFL